MSERWHSEVSRVLRDTAQNEKCIRRTKRLLRGDFAYRRGRRRRHFSHSEVDIGRVSGGTTRHSWRNARLPAWHSVSSQARPPRRIWFASYWRCCTMPATPTFVTPAVRWDSLNAKPVASSRGTRPTPSLNSWKRRRKARAHRLLVRACRARPLQSAQCGRRRPNCSPRSCSVAAGSSPSREHRSQTPTRPTSVVLYGMAVGRSPRDERSRSTEPAGF